MDKLGKLRRILSGMRSVVVAYSGGVDSTLLLKVAHEVLPHKVIAVTATSPTYTPQELAGAKKSAASIGAPHLIIKTHEFGDERFTANSAQRCYYCKQELLKKLRIIASKKRCAYVVEASTVTDKKDFRPGARAKSELGVRSPLQEAGFTKQDVRRVSRVLGLPTWNKPSQACLASRFPYGTRITPRALVRVGQAEQYLRKAGFAQVRLRHYQDACRIEVDKKMIPLLVARRQGVIRKLKQLGYTYITLDLEGFRSGSMNEALKVSGLA